MGAISKESTLYFEPEIHHALRVKAANTHKPMSEFVNEAVRLALREDVEYLSAFEERAADPTLSYEPLLKDLKSHGKLGARIQEIVAKDLRGIPRKDVARILNRIEALREDPRGEGRAKHSAQERYRVRQGLYRVVYEIRENELVVMVVKIGHRPAVHKSS